MNKTINEYNSLLSFRDNSISKLSENCLSELIKSRKTIKTLITKGLLSKELSEDNYIIKYIEEYYKDAISISNVQINSKEKKNYKNANYYLRNNLNTEIEVNNLEYVNGIVLNDCISKSKNNDMCTHITSLEFDDCYDLTFYYQIVFSEGIKLRIPIFMIKKQFGTEIHLPYLISFDKCVTFTIDKNDRENIWVSIYGIKYNNIIINSIKYYDLVLPNNLLSPTPSTPPTPKFYTDDIKNGLVLYEMTRPKNNFLSKEVRLSLPLLINKGIINDYHFYVHMSSFKCIYSLQVPSISYDNILYVRLYKINLFPKRTFIEFISDIKPYDIYGNILYNTKRYDNSDGFLLVIKYSDDFIDKYNKLSFDHYRDRKLYVNVDITHLN